MRKEITVSKCCFLCVCTVGWPAWKVINNWGCFPVADSHRDKSTWINRQAYRWTNKAQLALTYSQKNSYFLLYSMINKSLIVHWYFKRKKPSRVQPLNSKQTAWQISCCTNNQCSYEAKGCTSAETQTHTRTLDHFSQGNLTTFWGS